MVENEFSQMVEFLVFAHFVSSWMIAHSCSFTTHKHQQTASKSSNSLQLRIIRVLMTTGRPHISKRPVGFVSYNKLQSNIFHIYDIYIYYIHLQYYTVIWYVTHTYIYIHTVYITCHIIYIFHIVFQYISTYYIILYYIILYYIISYYSILYCIIILYYNIL
jgi:hypothetical protein